MYRNSPDDIVEGVASLSPNQRLCSTAEYDVWITNAVTSPSIVDEITRVRAHAFAHAGAGSGLLSDRDQYDEYYLQLFLWNRREQQIVGGYRLGLLDQILAAKGADGLYSASLFQLSDRFVQHLGAAIELGRSFVAVDYQCSFAPLLLLWKGIATFLSNNPRYHTLLGSVGIHNSYQPVSRRLIVEFLRANHLDARWENHVSARRPFVVNASHSDAQVATDSIQQLSREVSALEADEKGVPVLIRQYLKFGATFLDFHVDCEFESMACLLRVDLRNTTPDTLARYMGKARADAYFAYHHSLLSRSA